MTTMATEHQGPSGYWQGTCGDCGGGPVVAEYEADLCCPLHPHAPIVHVSLRPPEPPEGHPALRDLERPLERVWHTHQGWGVVTRWVEIGAWGHDEEGPRPDERLLYVLWDWMHLQDGGLPRSPIGWDQNDPELSFYTTTREDNTP